MRSQKMLGAVVLVEHAHFRRKLDAGVKGGCCQRDLLGGCHTVLAIHSYFDEEALLGAACGQTPDHVHSPFCHHAELHSLR